MKKKGIKMKMKRDGNILKSLQREINLNSRIVKSKKVYSRKQKHREFGKFILNII